ncbi:MAG: DUF1571 domain-containing protein [Mariniblastus sp.]|nr:DUF1571 domain-containing protein [Mariniblastus sp.]
MTSSAPSDNSQDLKSEESSRSGWGCLGKSFLLVGLILCGAFAAHKIYQINFAAKINSQLTEPVKIVTDGTALTSEQPIEPTGVTAGINAEAIAAAEHPLLPLLEVAKAAHDEMEKNVADYEATVVSQTRADGKLGEEKYMRIKIRHEQAREEIKVPFSVYTLFLKPRSSAGQEAIWVSGENEDKIIAHLSGLANLIRFKLDPEGALAMKGNRYTIRDIGMKNLLKKMLEKGEEGLKNDKCEVHVQRNVSVGDRTCTMLEIVYPEKLSDIDFHKARIFIDDQRSLPIAYEGYLWPEKPGGVAPLLEKYIYNDIQLNRGLTDKDFDPDNEQYNYPGGD